MNATSHALRWNQTRFLAGVVFATLLLLAATLWAYPSNTDFAVSNSHWNGLREATRGFEIIPLFSLRDLPLEPRGTVLIALPYRKPSTADMDTLKRYVEGGGVLVLMDDFGYGNTILARLGVGARFGGQVVVDQLFNYRNRRLVRIVIDLPKGPLTDGVRSLILNHATHITDTKGLTVVALSSMVSFVDTNGNGKRDTGEPVGPFPVSAFGPVGEGYLALVSDPSMLTNSMLHVGSNRKFFENLFRLAGENAQVYLDEAHLPRAPLDMTKRALAQLRALLTYPPITFALVAAGVALPIAMLGKFPGR